MATVILKNSLDNDKILSAISKFENMYLAKDILKKE